MYRAKNKESAKGFLNRKAQLDKEKAISAAKNPFESRMGETLIRNSFFHRKSLNHELDKIQQLGKRSFMHLEQQKKQFLQRHVLPEPTIIMERPPSPGFMETESYDSYLWDPSRPPHYMQPLKSRVKSAAIIPTIDMYQVRKKKKINMWETAMLERDPPQFQSCVVPSSPLTSEELNQMQREYNIQKTYNMRRGSPKTRTSPVKSNQSTKGTKSIKMDDVRAHKEPPSTVFLTQLVQAQYDDKGSSLPQEGASEVDGKTVLSRRSLSSANLSRKQLKNVV